MIEVDAGFWCVQRTLSNPVALAAMYRATRSEVAHAGRVGFDTAWFGEHHFCYDGYLPSPLLGMAAVSPVPDRSALPPVCSSCRSTNRRASRRRWPRCGVCT